METKHISVFKHSALTQLDIKPHGIYVDCTLGRAGHSLEIVKKLKTGKLICFDLDPTAIIESKVILKQYLDKIIFFECNFAHLKEKLASIDIFEVDGILVDLGVSSPQLDTPERGFSYRFDAPLDMRMDPNQSLSAKEVVNQYEKEDLVRILYEFGEEKFAPKIVHKILENRPIHTTFELVELIKSAMPAKELSKKGHPAKKTFQAIRIEVNKELASLTQLLEDAPSLLKKGGRLVIISFHSLEDRIVKKYFNHLSKPEKNDRRLPMVKQKILEFETWSEKISDEEISENYRSHSAHLRCLVRKEQHHGNS